MPHMKHTVKDSVFTYLFKQPEYLRQLYLSLHPEDSDVTEADFKLVTLENVLSTGFYNDLGMQVRDTLLLLIEAQSTFTQNITLRLLLYLASSYKEYVEEYKLDLYGSKPVTVPRPELYVIYTGSQQNIPDTLSLSNLYQGPGSAELQVTVLRGGKGHDILSQYVRFCQIADTKRKEYGREQEAIDETIRQCLAEDVLGAFLTSRKKEVSEIMTVLFDEAKIREIHDYNLAQEAMQKGWQRGQQEGHQKGRQEGRQEGQEAGIHAMVSALQELSIDRDIIVQKLAAKFSLLPHVAEEKVQQYWLQ